MKRERMETLSDGVIAIVLTLMILEIKIPALNGANLQTVFGEIGIYGLSFVVIAITWLNYNFFFSCLEKLNVQIIWLNLSLLFFMSLIPLPTKLLAENFTNYQSHLFYGSVLTLVSLCYTLLQSASNVFIKTIDKKQNSFYPEKTGLQPFSIVSAYLPA